jgi:methylated-DNA-[protein]-cysteine S-methyltransferase
MKTLHSFQARLMTPFGVLGICCTEDMLTGIQFLAPGTSVQSAEDSLAIEVCKQLKAYLKDASFQFDLPYELSGTVHQRKVWHAMSVIPCGQTRQYGELAKEISSSPRAVGQACGANPLPIIIPCHRVVSKAGMGGFANHSEGYMLDIKHWLLAHEQH